MQRANYRGIIIDRAVRNRSDGRTALQILAGCAKPKERAAEYCQKGLQLISETLMLAISGRYSRLQRGCHNLHASGLSSFKYAAISALLALALVACAKPEERSEEYYKKGLELIAKGDDLGAQRELLNALKYKSENIEAWRALTGANERIGATGPQFQGLRRIIELDPNDSDAKIRLAKMMLRGGAADAALKLIETITGQDGNADFHGTKASILLSAKDPAGALLEARKAHELDATNAEAAMILAAERSGRGDFPEALRLLNQAKVTDPNDRRIALAKVQVLERMGNLPQAESELRVLVDKTPKEMALRTQMVQLLAKQRKLDEAEKELRVIADANPSDSKPVLDLVRFILSTKGPTAAREELEVRISRGGNVFPYQMALVDLDIAQKNLAEASRLLERLTSEGGSETDKLTARVRLAEVKASQKDIPGAERLITDILNNDRRNAGALRLRAAIRLDRGETDAAISDLREALNEQSKAPELLILLAQAYERNGQNELADRQYFEATRVSEFNPAVAMRYVAFLQRSNNAARAEDILTDVARRNPQSVDVFSSLAQVRLSRKNWAGALEIADIMARENATKAIGEQIRAAALAGQNKPEESLAALERAHADAPNAILPVVSLVRTYAAQKTYDKAEKLLQEMTGKFPASAQLWVLSGQLQMAKGAPSEAQKAFEAAIKQAPKDVVGYTALAAFYTRQKSVDKALEVLQTGLKELPDNINLRLDRAGLLDTKGDHEAAIVEFEGILKDQPGSLVAINNLASIILDWRTDKPSLDRAQALVETLKSAKAPQFLDTIGWAAHLRGDDNAALPMLEQAKAQLPNVAAIRFHLGLVYRALGQEQKAVEELKAASVLETEDGALTKKIRAALN